MAYALARLGARYIPRLARYAARAVPRLFRKRRPVRPRMMRRKKITNKIHRYVRWADKDTTYVTSQLGPNTINETGANQNLTYQFKLDNIVNRSDYTNLYDSYRINKITLYLEPNFTSNGQFYNNFNVQSKKIRVVHDYTDASPLTQEDDYLEYSNCKSYMSTRNIKITLYPKIKNVIENKDGGANSFTSVSSNRVWLDCDDDEVPHFGLKIFIPGGIASNDPNQTVVQLFKVRAKFDLSFKNSK